MTWIKIIKEPAVNNAPPLFSIHYGERVQLSPAEKEAAIREIIQWTDFTESLLDIPEAWDAALERVRYYPDFFGMRENPYHDMLITWMGRHIKIRASEYAIEHRDSLIEWFFNPNHESEVNSAHLIPNGFASAAQLASAEDSVLRELREYAIIDGASPQMALMLTMGFTPPFSDEDELNVPNIGTFIFHPILILNLSERATDHHIYKHAWDKDGEYIGWDVKSAVERYEEFLKEQEVASKEKPENLYLEVTDRYGEIHFIPRNSINVRTDRYIQYENATGSHTVYI